MRESIKQSLIISLTTIANQFNEHECSDPAILKNKIENALNHYLQKELDYVSLYK